MSITPFQQQIVKAIDDSRENIVDVSHRIHARPELSGQEFYASSLLIETLESYGFAVEKGFAGIPTAFCARIGKPSGPKVAFLAEYDALPGLGHACGHNVIASTALGAGIGLSSLADDLPGEVWVSRRIGFRSLPIKPRKFWLN